MPVTSKARRRWFGTICLLAAIVMLATGDTTPGKQLSGMAFVLYWLGCLILASLALVVAIIDARALRREARAEQRDLLECTLAGIEAEKNGKTKPGCNASPSQSLKNPPST